MLVRLNRKVHWIVSVGCLLGVWSWGGLGSALPLSSPDRIHVPGGWFVLGANDDDIAASVALCRKHGAEGEVCEPARFEQEGPPRRVFVGAYRIDLREVSIADHRRCEFALRCTPPRGDDPTGPNADALPVTGVTYKAAQAYCAFAGGRLPSEAEWERAARGAGGRLFPWGATWKPALASHATNAVGPTSVMENSAGKSALGLLNMAGNVWELTSGLAVGGPGQSKKEGHVIRGGSYTSGPVELRATTRTVLATAASRPDVGFRCAYDR